MKLVPSMVSLLALVLLSGSALAGVYKCTDSQGKTAYQSSPCAEEKTALEIDLKTGGATDLAARVKQKEQEKELKQQKELEQQIELEKQQAKEAKRIKDASEQSAINQQQIKDNPVQYSAFAIPPYRHDKLPALVKKFEARLPEIEKFRRLAAQKALATGECNRVESDELSAASQPNQLIFSIDCSTAKNFQYNEAELLK
jgi:hypothetical protein